jgi:uncharacterized membrane protein YidH (DUF202 family)
MKLPRVRFTVRRMVVVVAVVGLVLAFLRWSRVESAAAAGELESHPAGLHVPDLHPGVRASSRRASSGSW